MANPEVFQLIDELSWKIDQLKVKAERAASGVPHVLSSMAKLNIRQVHKILAVIDAELEIAWHKEELAKARDRVEQHQCAIEKYNETAKKRTAFDAVLAESVRQQGESIGQLQDVVEQKTFGEEKPVARHTNVDPYYPMADEPQPKWANPMRAVGDRIVLNENDSRGELQKEMNYDDNGWSKGQ